LKKSFKKNFIIQRVKKNLILGYSNRAGRNFFGRKTILTQSGGLKSKLINFDFKRISFSKGVLLTIEKDINRSAFIGLICSNNGLFSYIILSDIHLELGDFIEGFSLFGDIKTAPTFLKNIKAGNFLHHIECLPGEGAKLSISAGVGSFLFNKATDFSFLKMRSGWLIKLSNYCIALKGFVSNRGHFLVNLRKAGKSRHLGFRPRVRGIAMNPCDHPHGGGEGRGSPPKAHRTPWGNLTKSPTKIKKHYLKKKSKFKIFK